MRCSIPLVLALAGAAYAAPSARHAHILHEKRAIEPMDWTRSRRLDPTHVLPMRFGLVQQNIDKLEELLEVVSSPHSPKFGQHYTAKEIVDTFAPHKDTISTVTDWLLSSGIASERLRLSADKGWIHLNATASEAESLLKAEYHVYTHSESGVEQIGV
jgi:tripeptidyl-peptidase-1